MPRSPRKPQHRCPSSLRPCLRWHNKPIRSTTAVCFSAIRLVDQRCEYHGSNHWGVHDCRLCHGSCHHSSRAPRGTHRRHRAVRRARGIDVQSMTSSEPWNPLGWYYNGWKDTHWVVTDSELGPSFGQGVHSMWWVLRATAGPERGVEASVHVHFLDFRDYWDV